jgi:UMF1 family MFS transporter
VYAVNRSLANVSTQAFFFLAILIGLPFPIMLLVNVDRGRAEGTALAKKLEELSRERDEAYVEDDDSNLSQEVREGLEESFSYQRS